MLDVGAVVVPEPLARLDLLAATHG